MGVGRVEMASCASGMGGILSFGKVGEVESYVGPKRRCEKLVERGC
jgi:hypothetical protein